MMRKTLIGVAIGCVALTAGAQTPTPDVPPAPRVEKPQPAKAPPAKLPPDVRDFSDEVSDFELAPSWKSLDLLEMDLAPAIPLEPLAPLEPMMPLEPLLPLDMFDVEAMLPMAPLEPMIPLELLKPLPPLAPEVPLGFHEMHSKPDFAAAPPTVWQPIPGQSPFEKQFGDISSDPPESWAQMDPADSLYRLARQTLNRGEYRRAAQLFGDISQRFPNSAYAADARYWRAFALYRIGGTNDLRDALATLETNGRTFYQASLKADAATLAYRIRGALAQRGDSRAITQVEKAAGEQGAPCDKEDAAVRTAALASLGELDQQSTTPILRRILARRDPCSASLRRNALFLLGKRGDPEAMSLIISSARNETDPHVRAEALRWLARMPGDEALATLEEIVRTPGNESMQRSAVAALARSETPRGRLAIKNIIERTELSESLRATALSSLADDRNIDDGAYLRSVYPRLDTPRLKVSAIRALARIGGTDNERYLISIVRNQNEPLDIRSTALTYAGRSTIPINDLVSMYDAAGERPLRTRLISLYGSRSEPEAADKLVAIAKTGTDPEMRRMAISALSRRNDPRTKNLLMEILDK